MDVDDDDEEIRGGKIDRLLIFVWDMKWANEWLVYFKAWNMLNFDNCVHANAEFLA